MGTSHEPTDVSMELELVTPGTYWDTYGGVDLASRIRGQDAIRITRGLSDQQGTAAPTQAAFTLNNADGLFTDDNPLSPLYGVFGSNTRVRLGVLKSGNWQEYLRMPDFTAVGTGQRAYTVDKASLRITGDIDFRIEFTPYYSRNVRMTLGGRYSTGGSGRCYFLEQRSDGQLAFFTSPDGTLGAGLTSLSVATVNEHIGRQAWRVTLDVDNGSFQRVYRWYTSDSISGTWTLVSTQTVGGATSIFAGTTDLEIGSVNGATGPFTDSTCWRGKIHAAEIYSGISGSPTLVADFKPAGHKIGVTTWTDTTASPNTWILSGGNIRLGSDRIRFSGEITSPPDSWDGTGRDVTQAVTAASLLYRYSASNTPLNSPIYRNYSIYPGLVGYWPMEDSGGATQAANVISNGVAGSVTSCTFGSTQDLDGSAGSVTLSSAPNVSKIVLRTNPPAVGTGYANFLFYHRLDTLPASDFVFCTATSFGTVVKWTISLGATGYTFTGSDLLGATVVTYSIGYGVSPLDRWIGMQIRLSQEGSNVRLEIVWHHVGSNTFFTHSGGGTTYAGTVGKGFRTITFDTPDSSFAGAQVAHVIVSDNSDLALNTLRFRDASIGYAGELFGDRAQRLATEEGFFFEWLGDLTSTAALGPQAVDTLYNILASGANVDGGYFTDIRDAVGFLYITREFLGNRKGITLDYSQSHLADTPKPDPSTRYLVNDYTATRPAGSSARYVANDGRRKNISDPPNGVGRYERSGAFNTADDDQLPAIAQLQVAIGTWDGKRIPGVSINLSRTEISGNLSLINDVIALDLGQPVTLTGLSSAPRVLPPDDLEMLAIGYTETITNLTWDTVLNTVPSGPYQVPIIEDPNGSPPRLDADNVTLNGAHNTTTTSIAIKTLNGYPVWCDSSGFSAEFPHDANLAGERVTVTAATAAAPGPVDWTFESGVTGWTSTGGTFAQSGAASHSGTKSGALVVTGTPTIAYARQTTANAMPVTPGELYMAFTWIRSGTTMTNVRLAIDWLDSSKAFLSTSDAGGSLTGSVWDWRRVIDVAPDGAAYAVIGPTAASSPATGSTVFVDDMYFSAAWSTQTLTVTRSVNGIVKSHTDGEPVKLFTTPYLGMG